MKSISIDIPDNNNVFVFVAPIKKTTKYSTLFDDPIKQFKKDDDIFDAKLIDCLIYPYNNLSEYHCKWAYNFTTEEMQKYLLKRWKYLIADTRIAFYLFEKIN